MFHSFYCTFTHVTDVFCSGLLKILSKETSPEYKRKAKRARFNTEKRFAITVTKPDFRSSPRLIVPENRPSHPPFNYPGLGLQFMVNKTGIWPTPSKTIGSVLLFS